MDLITYAKLNDNAGKVTAVIYNPSPNMDWVTDEKLYVEHAVIPSKEDIPNMDARLRIDLKTNELYFDYIARETIENKVISLQQENKELKQAIADLTMLLTTPSA
ncbi:hypothetical protein [Paenibacillus azoreducens]|uniref:Uncharacterized protein n=1 Tax=Paenibacillus azoreducens TaxID=116718 RepID=A0A919YE34_9BACL|nr:hypothetical protein [Paenibacillus azoreducens]GIO47963.1 hypothetical protein J34TS1_27280 [Paenibacillus azoreducens]